MEAASCTTRMFNAGRMQPIIAPFLPDVSPWNFFELAKPRFDGIEIALKARGKASFIGHPAIISQMSKVLVDHARPFLVRGGQKTAFGHRERRDLSLDPLANEFCRPFRAELSFSGFHEIRQRLFLSHGIGEKIDFAFNTVFAGPFTMAAGSPASGMRTTI